MQIYIHIHQYTYDQKHSMALGSTLKAWGNKATGGGSWTLSGDGRVPVCECVCVPECLLVSSSVCVCMCVSVYMYVCICVYLCVCTQGRQSTIMGAMGDSHESYAIVKASLKQSEDWDVSNPWKSCPETSRSRTVPSLLWASMSWSTVCASHLSHPDSVT